MTTTNSLLYRLSRRLALTIAAIGISATAFSQASFDQMKPFGFVTVSSRTDASKTYNFTAGGVLTPDAKAAGAVVLQSDGEGVDMRSKVANAISRNKVIILDGSNGDFTISSKIDLSGITGKTIIGINKARLCTKWFVTDEIKALLDAKNVKNASTSSGGGTLSNGQKITEEAEYLTRSILLAKYGNENYRSSGIFFIQNSSNIAIRNITFVGPGSIDVSGNDLISIYGSHHIWVDHCDFIDSIDGNLDITQKADFNTVSWCTFSYTDRSYMHQNTNLIGSSDSETVNYLNTTMAYNVWGKGCRARMPMARVGKIHVLNNFYDCKGNGTACINPRKNSEFLIEGNYFSKDISKIFDQSSAKAYVWSSTNVIARSGVSKPSSSGTVTVPYAYTLQPANDMPDALTQHAGATLTFSSETGIISTIATPTPSNDDTYNILGQKVSPSQKGLIIRNGHKIFQK